MLHPQHFLRNGGTLSDLESKYAIKHNRHEQHPNLVQLKYNQIESPMGEPLVRQCRGIILDEADNWNCVARPFDKFFNYGEGHAATIDWNTARVTEKLDGSLIILYCYNGEWEVATSGMPDARGEVNGYGFSFAKLFWAVWHGLKYPHPLDWMNPENTYMFELMTPFNRVVVPHKNDYVVLIGIRNTQTGQELPLETDLVHRVSSFPLQSFEQIEATFSTMNPLHQEGYVVVDGQFNRVKVKHPGYVALHHLRDGLGPKRILEVVRGGETTEFLTYFPEFTDTFLDIKGKFDALVNQLEDTYNKYKNIESQKEFALSIKGTPFTGAMFAIRAGQFQSVREYLAQVNIKHLVDTLKIKDASNVVD